MLSTLSERAVAVQVAESPEADDEPRVDDWQHVRARWEAQRVNVVLRAGSDLVAVIGNRTVRVGDVLEEGVRVVEIRPDSVLLEEFAPEVEAP